LFESWKYSRARSWTGQRLPGDLSLAENADRVLPISDHNRDLNPFSVSSFQNLEDRGSQKHHCKPFREKPPDSRDHLATLGVQQVTEIPEEGLDVVLYIIRIVGPKIKEVVSLVSCKLRDERGELDSDSFHV